MKLKNLLSDKEQKKLVKKDMPSWIEPMLATLEHDYFFKSEWLYERKLDGQRCLAFCDGKKVQLYSRNKNSLNDQYPELVTALERQVSKPCIVDGEIVAFKGNVTSFERLQKRMHVVSVEEDPAVAVYYYLFDLVYYDQWDSTQLPLSVRKKMLKKSVAFSDPIRFAPHRVSDTQAYFNDACSKGWEGLIVKKADSTYQHKRSTDWLKFKCTSEQELVIGGYTEPEGERIGFGALLVGYYKDDKLEYAGKVGTGFSDQELENLYNEFKNIEQKKNPFSSDEPKGDGVHWVKPELVAQVGFTEWTKHNKLRHPRYLGLRTDKDPKEVRQEK